MQTVQSLMLELGEYQWIGALMARASVGLLFAISGWGKLFTEEGRTKMLQTIRAAGVPFPELNARFVSGVELVFGVFLIIGFLTPLSAVMLIAVMLVALATTILPGVDAKSPIAWLGEVLYLPEVLFVVLLVWLMLAEPAWPGIDYLLLSS